MVAISAPSRPPERPKLPIARERLESLGVETTLLPTAERFDATEPAPPAERATEIEDAFADPEIRAVIDRRPSADPQPAGRVETGSRVVSIGSP